MYSRIRIIALGAILMIFFSGCSGGMKYEKYSAVDPKLNLSMEYIKGWTCTVQYGSLDSFVQAVFCEPGKDGIFAGIMAVTVKDSSKAGFSPKTIDGMLEDLIRRHMKYNSAKVVSKTRRNILGEDAFDVKFSYRSLNSFESAKAKIVPMKERVIIFKKDDKFYSIRYETLAENFNKYEKAFDHIVKSIKFLS